MPSSDNWKREQILQPWGSFSAIKYLAVGAIALCMVVIATQVPTPFTLIIYAIGGSYLGMIVFYFLIRLLVVFIYRNTEIAYGITGTANFGKDIEETLIGKGFAVTRSVRKSGSTPVELLIINTSLQLKVSKRSSGYYIAAFWWQGPKPNLEPIKDVVEGF